MEGICHDKTIQRGKGKVIFFEICLNELDARFF